MVATGASAATGVATGAASATIAGTASEEMAEPLALARAEAEAAHQHELAGRRIGTAPPTPDETLGHLPLPIRAAAGKATDWIVNPQIHNTFSGF